MNLPEHQNRRDFLKTLGAAGSLLTFSECHTGTEQSRPPNIIIILTDDQGYGDIGKYGARGFATPNLDRMASEGIMFTDFYVTQAVSSASRAGLLTGCYSERVSIQGALMPWATVGLNPEEETIATLLKRKGYATGMYGKWHLGHHREFLPLQHGFDEYFGLPYSNDMWPVDFDGQPMESGAQSSYPPLPLIEGNEKVSEIRTLDDQSKLTTLYTERAVHFIERHTEKPFFLYLAHSMPHVPLGVSSKFLGKSEQGMYGDVIMEVDWSVGEIFRAVSKAGVDENTLVIFASDNGPWLRFGNHGGSSGRLREGKGTMWEGGTRVPCIMRWPGKIPEGTVCRRIASTIDLLPTISAIAGADLPSKTIDGVNILPLMKGDNEANPRETFYYYYGGELQAVRSGKWKLHFPHAYSSIRSGEPGKDRHPGRYGKEETGLELYNLEDDIGENQNVAAQHQEIVARLTALGATAREELGDSITGVRGRGVRPPGRAGSGRSGGVSNLAQGKTITLAHPYSGRYPGAGNNTLIDGIRGSLDHADGAWQAFEGVDLDARIDLGEALAVRHITATFLENQPAWIFLPKEVEIAVSRDGSTFTVVKKVEIPSNGLNPKVGVRDIHAETPTSPVRYVRVTARNIGVCPSWHSGAGNKAWLFADEIILD
ncbi:MAG: atsA 6 [Bacteroidetes bacterium]|nr:atsA 6 [Bacteroidota bacterium]